MRWHIAGDVSARGERLAREIRNLGDTVVSRWLRDEDSDEPADIASQDMEDVAKSDGLVVLVRKSGDSNTGDTELGIALAFNKRIVVIGQKRSPFHYLSVVEHYATPKAFLETREDELNT